MRRRTAYAGIGGALALGAPLGLLLLRSAQQRRLSPAWLRGELLGDAATYGYVCLSTLVVFAWFGFLLGSQADRLLELSATDALTGLYNRRVLAERLEHELARAARYGEPLTLLMIDVDGLKQINDRDGHRAGDAALRQVAAAVRRGSRASDVPARWGGDEFAVLAPSTAEDAALRLAERVREQVAAGGGVTVSIGVATVPAGSSAAAGPDELARAADAALYEAKRRGRNRVASTPQRALEPPGAG